jgi:hypothetical protein
MVSDANLDLEVLIRERDLAINQARAQVAIQIAVLAVCLSIWAVLGFPRKVAWTVGIVTAGAVAWSRVTAVRDSSRNVRQTQTCRIQNASGRPRQSGDEIHQHGLSPP